MIVDLEQRPSDSPFVESVMHGFTVAEGSTIRPAESRWHLVFVREHGRTHAIVTGPKPTSGVTSWGEGAEILWIRLKLGIFMPHLPVRNLLDRETALPGTSPGSFWLHDSTWQLPDFDNADSFMQQLARRELLVEDPLVGEVLKGGSPEVSPRTLRHRFLQSTGMSHTYLRRMARAQEAADRLSRGAAIMDAVYDLGYYDQPHLTRSLRQFVGYTPGQILRTGRAEAVTQS